MTGCWLSYGNYICPILLRILNNPFLSSIPVNPKIENSFFKYFWAARAFSFSVNLDVMRILLPDILKSSLGVDLLELCNWEDRFSQTLSSPMHYRLLFRCAVLSFPRLRFGFRWFLSSIVRAPHILDSGLVYLLLLFLPRGNLFWTRPSSLIPILRVRTFLSPRIFWIVRLRKLAKARVQDQDRGEHLINILVNKGSDATLVWEGLLRRLRMRGNRKPSTCQVYLVAKEELRQIKLS